MSIQYEEGDAVHAPPYVPRTPGPEPTNITLDAIRQAVGVLLLPKKIPSGFRLAKTIIVGGHDVLIRYQKEAQGDGDLTWGALLEVRLVRRARLQVRKGFVEPISLHGGAGLVITGGWFSHGNAGPVEWDSDIGIDIVFEEGDWVVIVSGMEASRSRKYWSREALISIAESMEVA